MNDTLNGKRIAILATDGFEESELFTPKERLEAAGARTDVIAPAAGEIRGFRHLDPGRSCAVDIVLADADPAHYDALVLPGGVANPDATRTDPKVRAFVRAIFDAGKPTAAICHAPWVLIDAGIVEGRRLTSYPTLRTDLRNAGAKVEDAAAVVDGQLLTSRDPDDLPAFCAALIDLVAAREPVQTT